MTIGTGLFMLGVWLSLAAAYISPSITSKGLEIAHGYAAVATAVAVGITFLKIAS